MYTNVTVAHVLTLSLYFFIFLDLFESLEVYIPGLHVMKYVSLFWQCATLLGGDCGLWV